MEFKENNILINAKNSREIKENMAFNLCFPFSGLKSEKDKNYAIMIADTIIIKATQNEILTNTLPIKYKDVSYALEVIDIKIYLNKVIFIKRKNINKLLILISIKNQKYLRINKIS